MNASEEATQRSRVFTRLLFCAPSVNFIQLIAREPTEWTTRLARRYRSRMNTKRSKYDPLATSAHSRWLVLRDMFHNVLDSTELPSGTDLRHAFAKGLTTLERAGWQSEGASGAMVFVSRGGERRFLAIHELDPHEPPPPGHGVIAGRCATCD
jgi:hypothetical protein